MNKAELIDRMCQVLEGTTKRDAGRILDAFTEVVMETVASKDKVVLVGFGTFEARDRQARQGRNPSTGETLAIPACTVPAFTAGKGFKDLVAEGKK